MSVVAVAKETKAHAPVVAGRCHPDGMICIRLVAKREQKVVLVFGIPEELVLLWRHHDTHYDDEQLVLHHGRSKCETASDREW